MSTHNQVAHAFANRRPNHRKGFAMFHDGDTLYSWGYHYAIAKHVVAPDGTALTLFNSEGYSVSTGKHRTITRRALGYNNPNVLEVPLGNGTVTPEAWYHWALAQADLKLKSMARRRVAGYKAWDAASAQGYIELANRISTHWQLGFAPVELQADVSALLAASREAERIERERREASAADRMRQWLDGVTGVTPPHTHRPLVRVVGQEVQTSWGVRMSLKIALGLYERAKRCREAKRSETYGPSSFDQPKVDGWDLKGIDEEGTVTIGCHVLTFEAMHDAAVRAGLDV